MTKGKDTKRQTKQWPKEKIRKDRQYNDQRKMYEKTDNTMTKGKGTNRQTTTKKTKEKH